MSFRSIALVLFGVFGACFLSTACTYDLPQVSDGGNGGAGTAGASSTSSSVGSAGAAGMGGNAGAGGAMPADWWDNAWSHRVRITFKHSGDKTLTNFPVMVRLDASRVPGLQVSSNGADLRFIDDDGKTILAHETERFQIGGDSIIWVQVPSIEPTESDHIWLYYGNTTAPDAQDAAKVWNDFVGVYHLSPSPIVPVQFANSAGANPGKWHDDIPGAIVPGKINEAIGLDGMRFIDVGDNGEVAADKDEGRTIEAWVNTGKTQDQEIVYEEGECVGWSLGMTGGNYRGKFITDFEQPLCNGVSEYVLSATASLGSWHHLTLVIDRPNSQMRLFFNGTIVSSTVINNTEIADGNGVFRIGSDHDGGNGTFIGAIDEVRVSKNARSDAWIAAQHKSMTDVFLTFKAE